LGQQEFGFKLPELDRDRTQREIEECFERYRFYKSITFDEREVNTTASYADRPSGPTNVTSDSTAAAAIYNVDEPERRRQFCERVDRAVKKLPPRERLLITERYLKDDYLYDWTVYQQVFNPPISKDTYAKIRWKAFYRLAFIFDDMHLLKINQLVK